MVEGRNYPFSHATYLALELFASQPQDQVLNPVVETLHLGIEHYRDVALELKRGLKVEQTKLERQERRAHNVSFWAQKLTHYVSFWIQKTLK